MHFYDIVLNSCDVSKDLTAKLGFTSVGRAGSDIGIIDANAQHVIKESIGKAIAFGSDEGKLSALVRKGVAAVHIDGYKIDRKLMEEIAANDCILCIDTKSITNSYGTRRTKALYRASRLFKLAKKRKIRVSFATMAASVDEMLSKIQIIEIAKLIGADEQYARYSISEINGYLVGNDD
ncbi:MAG: hypothetical protein M1500_03050 [Candidatus Marsarchaeota archaeon]|nr:hypothetical protein [Candidatus Marsarchaeota archaeon]MCL5112660.1 hypothetical protein [Candidatus Marsarchaeota archaeon]